MLNNVNYICFFLRELSRVDATTAYLLYLELFTNILSLYGFDSRSCLSCYLNAGLLLHSDVFNRFEIHTFILTVIGVFSPQIRICQIFALWHLAWSWSHDLLCFFFNTGFFCDLFYNNLICLFGRTFLREHNWSFNRWIFGRVRSCMQAHEIEQLLRPGVVVLTPQIFADILSRVYNFVLVILITDDFLEVYIFSRGTCKINVLLV